MVVGGGVGVGGLGIERTNPKLYDVYDPKVTSEFEKRLLESPLKAEFTDNAISVLTKRYFAKDERGIPQEDARSLFARVAANVSYPDIHYTGGNHEESYASASEFFEMMLRREFMPNSPTLMNAGRRMQQLSACFVLPIEDNMDSIFGGVRDTAKVHQTGGGTGFSFGNLRRKNDFVSSTYGKASGPVSFLQAYDAATDSVNQGGFRRGANMGMMPIDHPDILYFIHSKENSSDRKYSNFNFSVSITDEFMEAVREERNYPLMNPRGGVVSELTIKDLERDEESVRQGLISGEERVLVRDGEGNIFYQNPEERNFLGNVSKVSKKKVGMVDEAGRVLLHAPTVFEEITRLAWKNGEPGVAFIDRMNANNPTHPRYLSSGSHEGQELPRGVGLFQATNPCGEQPLLGYEACNLGSINLGLFVRGGEIDYSRLEKVTEAAVHFLDNVVDMSKFPLEQIVETVHANRKIGLGVMGFADMLAQLEVPYGSEKGRDIARKVMGFIDDRAKVASHKLAEKRGAFPNFENSMYRDGPPIRNATRTTVAPTGSISIIAGAFGGGDEPFFDLVYFHTDADGHRRKFVNPYLLSQLERDGVDSEKVLKGLEDGYSLQSMEFVPEKIRKVFVKASEISVEDHVRMQAAFQEYTNNAVSKTINMPNSATMEDVKEAYLLAFDTGCKGITVYRDGSRDVQVLSSSGKGLEGKSGTKALARGVTKPVPDHLPAVYVRQPTPWGHLHLNVSLDPREDYNETQIFAQLGKAGDVVNADLEAIGRLASTVMRLGGDLEKDVISQLEGIGSHKRLPTVDGGVVSLPDGLGKALQSHADLKKQVGAENMLLGKYDLKEIKAKKIKAKLEAERDFSNEGSKKVGNGDAEDYAPQCPECGEKLLTEAACWICSNIFCGYSKC